MADHSASSDPHADADFQQHHDTYNLFLGLTKWVVVACVIILVGMAVFLL